MQVRQVVLYTIAYKDRKTKSSMSCPIVQPVTELDLKKDLTFPRTELSS